MYTIKQIEDTVITALAPLKISLDVRSIKSYQGELESENEISRIVGLFPAIYVVYGGSGYDEHGARKIERMSFHIIACDRSLRSETEARRGGAMNPGIYAMLDGIRDILYGEALSMEIFPFSLIRQEPVWFGKGFSLYAAEYQTAHALLYP